MKRIEPAPEYKDEPCSIVAVSCAVKCHVNFAVSHIDGYMTLEDMNRIVRRCCSVKKRTDYKRGQRPLLKELHHDGKAIVCVRGHYVYLNNETYWSYFDNENDEVVAIWILK